MKTTMYHHMLCTIMFAGLFLSLTPPAGATDPAQPLTTLELVRTYPSEETFKEAYQLQREKAPIVIDGENIIFFDAKTHKIHKQFKQEKFVLTPEEKRQLQDPNNTEPVIKDYTEYTIVGNYSFLIRTEFTYKLLRIDSQENILEIKKKILYNAHGDHIADLPHDISEISVSPNNQYFVAYSLGGIGDYDSTDFFSLYFYSMDGTLLKQQELHGKYDTITFSTNGEFIGLFHSFGRAIAIFAKTGDIIYEDDYKNLLRDKTAPLYNMYVSENGRTVLLNTDQHLYLCTIDGELLWEQDSSPALVSDCYFFSLQNIIALKVAHRLEIRSLHDGVLLDEIGGISEISRINDHLVIKREEKYYEYTIRQR